MVITPKSRSTTVPVKDLKPPEEGDLSGLSNAMAPLEMFDDRSFKFRVELINKDGKRLGLAKGAIEEMVLTDSIYNWWTEGYIIYNNEKDWAERKSDVGDDGAGKEMETWRFRGDGRDFVQIYIDPVREVDPVENQQVTGFNFSVYTISLFACIYDVEDIPSNGPKGDVEKSKKIYFRDFRRHSMVEKNSYWNTVDAATRKGNLKTLRLDPSQLSNSARSVLTGVAIKDLLETQLNKLGSDIEFETDIDDNITWNNGSSTIFHHAGGNETSADTLEYLLNCHSSDNSTRQQPCILQCSRDDKWSLLPLEEYYTRSYDKQLNRADGWLSELFLIAGEGTNEQAHIPNKPRVPQGFDWFFNVYNEDTNNISSYEFTEMSYEDHPTSVNVHSYDSDTGQFIIQQESGDIQKTKEFFQSVIVDKAYGDPSAGPSAAMVLNKSKIENEAITNIWTSDSSRSTAINVGRNRSIQQMMFLGNAIRFNCKGMTNRQSGRLIGLDRQSYYEETDYDDKLLGCYFITTVTHKITPAGYNNEIIGVKPYHFKNLGFNEEDAS